MTDIRQGDYCYSSEPENVFYHDLSPYEQERWIAQLSHTATAVFSGKNTYEPWKDMPCSYIFCDQDRAIPLYVQEGIARGMGDGITTFHVDASHSPFLSVPEKLVEGIALVAMAGQEKIRAKDIDEGRYATELKAVHSYALIDDGLELLN